MRTIRLVLPVLLAANITPSYAGTGGPASYTIIGLLVMIVALLGLLLKCCKDKNKPRS